MSTLDVLDHHLQAFTAGDVDEILKDFTEDSILIEPEATHRGLADLRTFFAGLFDSLFKPGSYDFTMDRSTVEGDVAYIVWHSKNQGVDVSLGTDTFIVRDGKIAVQTFSWKIDKK